MVIRNWIKNLSIKEKDSYVLLTNLIFAVYFIVAHIGLKLATLNAAVSPVWPATGVAIGAILFFGYRFLPAIYLGAFLTNYLTNIPLASVFFIAMGNSLEAFAGAYCIKYIQSKREWFGIYCTTASVIITSVLASIISATIGVASLTYFQATPIEQFNSLWLTWWTGDTLGGIIILPLVFIIFTKHLKPEPKTTPAGLISIILLGTVLSYLLYINKDGAPSLFLVFPFLLYCVVKTGIRGVTFATIILCFLGIIAVDNGSGIFLNGSLNTNFVNLQFFLACVGLCSLVLSDLSRASLLKRPSFALVSTWLVVGLIYYGFHTHDRKEEQERFENIVESVPPMVEAKINIYFSTLQNGASLFAASDKVTRNEWKNFINQGNYFSSLSALKWIGVVYPVKDKDLNSFIETQKKEKSSFDIHKIENLDADEVLMAEHTKEHFIVTYMEPIFESYDRVGFDLATEKKRHFAAEMARDLNRPQISSPVMFDTGKGLRATYIAFYPFYTKNTSLNTLEDKRKHHVGWIYGPIDVEDFFNSLFKKGPTKDLSFKVYGANDVAPVYTSEGFDSIPGSFLSKEIFITDQKIIIQFKRSSEYLNNIDKLTSLTGAFAAILSILLGTFIISLQSSRSTAVNEAEKTTEELRASEELLKFALEGSGDAVWDWEIQNGFVAFSSLFSTMLGHDKTHKISGSVENLSNIIHPEDREKVLEELFAIQDKKKEGYSAEVRIRCKNGTYKWFLTRGMIVKTDTEGKPLRMVGTISDISLRKQSEEMIENERTKFKATFEAASDAIILFTEPWQIYDCNIAAVKMFGYQDKETFLEQTPTTFSSMPFTTSSTNHFDWQFMRKNGDLFPAEVVLNDFIYNGTNIVQASIRDISERKRYEDSLRRQREMLVASAKLSSLGEMAGGIAHEINNPLSIIIGKVSQLKRISPTATPEKLNEEMNVIDSTAKRIASIIKGLKSFSRNAEKDEKQTTLVTAMMHDLFEISKERFKFHQIHLDFVQKNDKPIYVNCRTAQLLQVLVNLLNNAFDAVEHLEEKWVRLELDAKSNHCVISIIDSGHGIDPRIVEKIMSPFFTTKPVDKGTGLGLSISKAIIEEHDGNIYYDSSSSNTKFVIELPLASAEDVHFPSVH
jgi:PAS domain S-box-containing protein